MQNDSSTKFQDMMKSSFKKKGVREGDVITEKAYAQMVDDFTIGAYLERMEKSKMTGERVVFKPHKNKNYYLTLAFHSESDDVVLERIKDNCNREFPFLFL